MVMCETPGCGHQATVEIADFRQTGHTHDPKTGKDFVNWEVHSRHSFCKAHERAPIRYLIDGTQEQAITEFRE